MRMPGTKWPKSDWRRGPAGKAGLQVSPRPGGLTIARRLWVYPRHPHIGMSSRAQSVLLLLLALLMLQVSRDGYPQPSVWDLSARCQERRAQLQLALPLRG